MYSFNKDANGTIFITSRITGINYGLANLTDYNLMLSVRDGDPNLTSAQRATVKFYLSQINPLPSITDLNGAVLNLAQNNANQTTALEAYISTH